MNHTPRFGSVVDTMAIRPFCGPAVLSVLSGIDVAEIVRMILRSREDFGYKPKACRRVIGMSLSEMLHHIENELGLLAVNVKTKRNPNFDVFNNYSHPFPTLTRWLKDSADWRGDDVYLILTSSHYLLICGNRIVDNGLRFPRALSTVRKYRRSRIHHVYCIMKP